MKIYMVDPSAFTFSYDNALCDALAKQGNDVRLLSRPERFRGELSGENYVREEFFYGASEALRRAGWPRKACLFVKALEHLFDMGRLLLRVRRNTPDVIHFQWTPIPLVDRWIVRFIGKRVPVVLTVHDVHFLHGHPSCALQMTGWQGSLKEYFRLVVHTHSALDMLARRGVPPAKIEVVSHGALMLPVRADVKASHVDPGNTVLLFGSVKPYKGVDVLIRAWAMLHPDLRRHWQLIVAGSGKRLLAQYRKLARDLGVLDDIRWMDRFLQDQELVDLIAHAKIVVFPYREIDASGAFETTVPFGKAVIASNIGAFSEALTHSKTGLLCEPGSEEDLAQKLGELMNNPALVERLGRNLMRLSRGRDSWKTISARTIEIYLEAVHPKSRAIISV